VASRFGSVLILVVTQIAGSLPAAYAEDGCGDNFKNTAKELESSLLNGGELTGRKIWGKWDCSSCEKKGISARPNPGEK
jgi:hypothetical protein